MGGAVHIKQSAEAKFTGTTFRYNKATATNTGSGDASAAGGAVSNDYFSGVANQNSTMTFTNVLFDGNSVISLDKGYGGAVYLMYGNGHSFDQTTFSQNTVSANSNGAGGAIWLDEAAAITKSKFERNSVSVLGANGYGEGGAITVLTGKQSITDSDFINNSVEATQANSTVVGGAVSLNGDDATFENVLFQGNSATALEYRGRAQGGAVSANGASTFTKTNFDRNSALASGDGGVAQGGAVWYQGTLDIEDSSYVANKASGEKAEGGAIYMDSGELNLTNTDFINNQAVNTAGSSGGYANGGAIFMNTSAVSAVTTLNMTVADGEEMLIQGNYAGTKENFVHFGGSEGATSYANGVMNIDTKGTGKMSLLNPVTVDMNNSRSFALTKMGTGELVWGGVNTFKTDSLASVDIQEGTLTVTDRFTARGEGTGDYTVTIRADSTIVFSPTRQMTPSMFDFKNTGTSRFIVEDGATLKTSTGREIKSKTWEYYIASGLHGDQGDIDIDNAIKNFDFIGSDSTTQSLYNDGAGSLVAKVEFRSPYESVTSINTISALDALEKLVKLQDEDGLYLMNEDEYKAVLSNPYSVTAELYMDQGRIMSQAVGDISDIALKTGVRDPHQMQLSQQCIPFVGSNSGYGSMAEYYDGGAGPRVWLGYVGDFRRRDTDHGFNGYRVDRNGLIAGFNYDYGYAGSIGIYGGYTKSKSKAKRATSESEADIYYAGITGRLSPLAATPEFSIYIDGGVYHASNEYFRKIGAYSADGDFDQDLYTASIGAEYSFHAMGMTITPHARLRYTYIDQDGLTEKGFLATRTDGFKESALNSRVGLEISKNVITEGGAFIPSLNVAWRHDFGDLNWTANSYYLDDPTPAMFQMSSSRMTRDSLDIGVAAKAIFNIDGCPSFAVNFGYNFNLARRTTTHSVYAAAELAF